MAPRHDYSIDAGATFTSVLTYTNPDGSPIVLTGYTAKWQARRSPEAATADIDKTPAVSGPAGTVTLTLTAAETSALSGRYLYAVEVAASGGEPVIRLVEGQITITQEVVR